LLRSLYTLTGNYTCTFNCAICLLITQDIICYKANT